MDRICQRLVRTAFVLAFVIVTSGARALGSWPSAFVTAVQVPIHMRTADGRAITVLDARDRSAYRRGHIPGSQHAPWTRYRAGWFRSGRLPEDLDKLARSLAKLGVDDRRPVLVCGEARQGWGEEGRIAWMLRYLGHAEVAILSGGCGAWQKANRPFTRDIQSPVSGRFTARPRRELRAFKEDVVAAMTNDSVQLLDVRTRAEFGGATPYLEPRGGHIPSAKNVPFSEFLDSRGHAKHGTALERLIAETGLVWEKPLITYCTGGVRSALVTEILRNAGLSAANYDASFWEWSADRSLPVKQAVD